jgi:hypothetical protein
MMLEETISYALEEEKANGLSGCPRSRTRSSEGEDNRRVVMVAVVRPTRDCPRLPHPRSGGICRSRGRLLALRKIIEVHRGFIRKDKQTHDGIRRYIGKEALDDQLAGSTELPYVCASSSARRPRLVLSAGLSMKNSSASIGKITRTSRPG